MATYATSASTITQLAFLCQLSKTRVSEMIEPAELLRVIRAGNVRKLNFVSRRLNQLPAVIGEIKSCEELYLQKNDFKSLPFEIANLKKVNLGLRFNFDSFAIKNRKFASLVDIGITMRRLANIHKLKTTKTLEQYLFFVLFLLDSAGFLTSIISLV